MSDLPYPDPAPRLLSRPGVQKVPTPRAEMFIVRDFLPAELCAALCQRIDADRMPSTLADPNGDAYFRTSETCHFPPDDPAVVALEALLADLSGIPPEYGEPLQGQRYCEGQEFKAHTDYFEPGGADFERFCTVAGQRTWTFMAYLDAVAAGGATRFKVLDKIIQPEPGKLVCWNNRRGDGSVNPATIHHAMKVRKGVKHIVTRWYRERPWG